MARRYYSSTAARTTLASGVDDTTTTLSVTAVSGWPASYPYTLVIDQDTVNEELVEVSARSGTTLTVTRGVDGTSAVAHDAGAAVNHGVSARDFDEPNDFINGTGVVTSDMIVDGTIVNADVNASAAIAQSKIADLTSDLAEKLPYSYGTAEPTTTTDGFVWFDENFSPPVAKVWNGSAFVAFSQGPADFSDSATGTYTDTGVSYKYITYTASGTLTVTRAGFADVLVIAGGGAGGVDEANSIYLGGGGGAGGYYEEEIYMPTGTHTVTVGGGGAANTDPRLVKQGSSSRIGDFIGSPGGGRGGGVDTNSRSIDANSGGSGGGVGGGLGAGSGMVPFGNSGGGGGGGGGGGAGGIGGTGSSGAGGAGTSSSITGSAVARGGGGGGSPSGTATAGGGAGGSSGGSAGSANTGGGGGGSANTTAGGNGGSGVVIVRVKV